MKTFLLILFLCGLAMAEPKTYLADRAEAIRALESNSVLALTEHKEGAETRGKVTLVIDGEVTTGKLRDALILSLGIVFETTFPDCTTQTFRGHLCTTTAR
jgi:hypothetical protein